MENLSIEPLIAIIAYLSPNPLHFSVSSAFLPLSLLLHARDVRPGSSRRRSSTVEKGRVLSVTLTTTAAHDEASSADPNMASSADPNMAPQKMKSMSKDENETDPDELIDSQSAPPKLLLLVSRLWAASNSLSGEDWKWESGLERINLYHMVTNTKYSHDNELWGVCDKCFKRSNDCWCGKVEEKVGCTFSRSRRLQDSCVCQYKEILRSQQINTSLGQSSKFLLGGFKALHESNRPRGGKLGDNDGDDNDANDGIFFSGLEMLSDDGASGEIKRDAVRTYADDTSGFFGRVKDGDGWCRGTNLADCLSCLICEEEGGYCQGMNFLVANLIKVGLSKSVGHHDIAAADLATAATAPRVISGKEMFIPTRKEMLVCHAVSCLLRHLRVDSMSSFGTLSTIWEGSPLQLQLKAATLKHSLLPTR